ncbi:MAG TPA: VOC family protein [Candidatus Sulfotelmatobacter sp.]|nr:VOC family protein [Candidatus Sulfotelmatobacter sp.]
MPKRSLNSGSGDTRKIEQLNQAVEKMLAQNDGRVTKAGAEIEPLVRIAADLRNLPSATFKARLKSKLGGKKAMSTAAEPVTTAHAKAAPRMAFKDAGKAIEFYKNALGAREVFRFEVGGHIPHAEIAIGDSIIMVTEEWPEGGRFSAETWGHSPVMMSLEVDDVDSFAAHAEAAGMKMVIPPKDQFYGRRDATLVDPFGYTWSVSTVVEEMSVEEMRRRMKGLATGPEAGQLSAEKEKRSAVSPTPRGFRMVTPYLVAADGLALLEFTKQGLGAEEMMRAMMPTGVHAEVRIGDTTLMMGGGIPGKSFPGTLQPNALHIYVEDADAVTKKAVAAGATLIDEVRDQEYGERSSTVKDQAGNFWYIATAKGESHVPKGLHSVNPYLHPRRAEPLISFLKRAFGAQEVTKYASPDGVVQHAVVKVGDSVLEMGEAHGKYEPMEAMFYLYVPDMEAVYRQALAAGATSFQEPTDQPYGDRNAGVKDAFGNKWYIATHVKDVAM